MNSFNDLFEVIIDAPMRHYLVTIRASRRDFKGNKARLQQGIEDYLKHFCATLQNISFEKEGTDKVHAHFLMHAPYINNYKYVCKLLRGFHIHTELVRKQEEEEIEYRWKRYIEKEHSVSDQIHAVYGNMFTQVD